MRRSELVAQAGVIAAVYAALTLLVLSSPIGYGPVQLRLSEAVTVVAALTPAGAVGLFVGSLVANSFMLGVVGSLATLDIVFGSLATLLGAIWTWRFRQRTAIALAGPVIFNALIVPAYLPIMLAGQGFYRIPLIGLDISRSWPAMYAFGVVAIGAAQAVVVYGLGWPLLVMLRRLGVGVSQQRRNECDATDEG